jgi:hypothetical protein
VEVDRFEDGDAPRRALDRDSAAGPRAELAVLADPERRVAESRLYCAEVDQAYGEARDAHTQSLPELRAIQAKRVEVFDQVEATQAPRDVGSVLTKSFNGGSMTGETARKRIGRGYERNLDVGPCHPMVSSFELHLQAEKRSVKKIRT